MKLYKTVLGVISLVFMLLFCIECRPYAAKPEKDTETESKYSVLVDISEFRLYLIDEAANKIEKVYPIAGGKPSTPSPYGTWTITFKEKNWGAGFGTRWMRLDVPWGDYGIHGTNKPLTINNPDSLGCIRMFNSHVEELYDLVDIGTKVVVYAGPYDLDRNVFRTLMPGDKGADVFEVQRRLRYEGYYSGELNGIYGEDLKKAVIRFKKDRKLEFTHFCDKEFYDALRMKPFD
ncbi:MAG: L,D-transpeptidase family protein [Bacillota bacterium]|nr:L,D-transpeptidase family protein [Bacillota bacterium]